MRPRARPAAPRGPRPAPTRAACPRRPPHRLIKAAARWVQARKRPARAGWAPGGGRTTRTAAATPTSPLAPLLPSHRHSRLPHSPALQLALRCSKLPPHMASTGRKRKHASGDVLPLAGEALARAILALPPEPQPTCCRVAGCRQPLTPGYHKVGRWQAARGEEHPASRRLSIVLPVSGSAWSRSAPSAGCRCASPLSRAPHMCSALLC